MTGLAIYVARLWLIAGALVAGCGRTDFAAVRCPEEFSEGVCAPASVSGGVCGMQLGTSAVAFCDTFDAPFASGGRGGALNGDVWTVSRAGRATNFAQLQYNPWSPTTLETCDGPTSTPVLPPNDIVICDGQLREGTNDAGGLTVLAMVAMQPFDFAGRTGTVSFDVSNDSAGTHAAWPQLWLSSELVPAPFNYYDSPQALPEHGFAVRFAGVAAPGDVITCPDTDDLDQPRWTVDSAAVVRNYVLDDTNGFGPRQLQLTRTGCVIAPSGPGEMNHVELRISQTTIEVWATDAGVAPTAASLKRIAELSDASLGFSRGYIALQDVHFDADGGPTDRPSQREHTFAWDNVAFDGPPIPVNASYNALDDATAGAGGVVNLGQFALANQTTTWDVLNVPADRQASGARVVFNFYDEASLPSTLNVTVNGHAHARAWPFPDARTFTWRTVGVSIDLTDLVTGTNIVELGADADQVYSNVDIVLLP